MTDVLRHRAVEVRVPASSANLGPGFDVAGLALALHDHVTAMATDDPGVRVEVRGEGAGEVPDDERHLVARAMAETFALMAIPMPGLLLTCVNGIPHGRGLGSSAAAIVAGIAAARALVVDGEERLDDNDILDLATRMEGHPDNVAAALLGGFTTAWVENPGADDPHARAVAHAIHPDIVPVAFVPPTPMATESARRMLPDVVSREDAVFNVSRAALLVHAVTHDPEMLFSATEDRLHQDARASAYPESYALVRLLRSHGVAAVVSGAGPTVLALADVDSAPGLARDAPRGWRVLYVGADAEGVVVRVSN